VLASIGTWVEHFHGPAIYVVVGALVFGEAAVLLGFVIPGETAAVAGGALCALGHANLELMLVVVVVCAIVGDSVGYEVGKVLGPHLLERRPLRGHQGVAEARRLLVRFGGPAVFVGRWVALARALVPGLTGMSGMRYRTFLFFNALGGMAWGTAFVFLGYAAGRSWEALAARVGRYAIYALAGFAAVLFVMIVLRRRRGHRGGTDSPATDAVAGDAGHDLGAGESETGSA